MDANDLRTLSRLGRTVWVNSEDWERSTLEVVTAVSLLDLTQERAAERAAGLLLHRARRAESGHEITQERDLWLNPFYRLPVDQRFILSGLHGAGWSYSRFSRILGISVAEVEQLAWNARVQLTIPAIFPSVIGKRGENCPDYEPSHPWTQRFLDDEIGSRGDQVFLQKHLVECDSCRRTLERCRDAYYQAERRVPSGQDADLFSMTLERTLLQSPNRKRNQFENFAKSLFIFFNKKDIQLLVIIAGLLIAYLRFRVI